MGSLQKLKDQSGSWVGKIVLGVVASSFLLVGVVDMAVRYTQARPVSKVGGEAISPQEFQSALKRAIHNLQQSTNQAPSAEEIQRLEIPQKVLDRLQDEAAMREELSRLKLVIHDEAVKDIIHKESVFQNDKGEYDPRHIQMLLKSQNLTESQFVHKIRLSLLENQLASTLSSGMTLPHQYVHALYKFLQSERELAIVMIPVSKMPRPARADEGALKVFYEANRKAFTFPEVRTLSLLQVDIAKLKATIAVSEEELKEAFETRKTEFDTPEKRDIEEIMLGQVDSFDAQKAIKEWQALLTKPKAKKPVSAGKTIADKYKGNYRRYESVSKTELPEAFAKEAFFVPVKQVRSSARSVIGVRLYMVNAIQASQPASFEKARSALEDDIKTQKVNDMMNEIRNRVEDSLASGESYEEIAKRENLVATTYEAITKEGQSVDRKVSVPNALRPVILDPGFALAEGADSAILEAEGGAISVVRAVKISPSYIPELKDITESVQSAWERNELENAALKLAQDIAQKVNAGEKLDALAKTHQLTVQKTAPTSFMSISKDGKKFETFSPALINKAFSLKEGRATSDRIATRSGAQIVLVQKILPYEIDASQEEYKKFVAGLTQTAQKDVMDIYVHALKEQFGVSVNQSIYQAIVGSL